MSTQNFPAVIDLSPEKLQALASILKEEGIEWQAKRVIDRRPNSEETLLSFSQERIWFLDKLEPGNHYNDYFGLRIKGRLDYETLERSIEIIARRHETLRTNFVSAEGQALQVIGTDCRVNLAVTDLSNLPERDRASEAVRLAVKEVRQLFDLTKDPLFRTMLIRLSEEEHIFLLAIHQIINDSWSIGVFASELLSCYQSLTNAREPALPSLPVQYADFAHWQRNRLQETTLSEQLSYWKGRLTGAPPILQLPSDRPRPATQTFQGRREPITLPANLTRELKRLSQREDTTLFMTLMAAFKVLLYRYTGQEDVIVGLPISIRTHAELEALIGMFVNTLVLRTSLSDAPSFRELLARVREGALGAYAHQELPFELLVKETQPQRNLGNTPIFQVLFDYQNAPMPALDLTGLELTRFEIDSGTSKYDLTLELAEVGDIVQGWFEYNSDLFDRDRIARMAAHFQTLLEAVVHDPGQSISTLPLMTREEQQQVLVEWNATEADYPLSQSIHEVFEAQVERTPDNVALVFEGQKLSYDELNQQVNKLAHYLIKCGVTPGTFVAVCLERSFESVVALIAILKVGAAYVPLDPAYPKKRLEFMVADCKAALLLTRSTLLDKLPEQHDARTICLDRERNEISGESEIELEIKPADSNAAYVIYTSGSTGEPKGVIGTHRGALNRFHWMWEKYPFEAGEVCCQKTSLSFVDSIWEIFGPLLQGMPMIIIADDVVKDPNELVTALAAGGVTRIVVVPSLLEALLNVSDLRQRLPKLRYWVTSGEALSSRLFTYFQEKMPEAALLNLYGSSEVAADSTCYEANGYNVNGFSGVPIGKPISNTKIYILDNHGNPVPIGIPGELYIGGFGLVQGYLFRPKLSGDRFLTNPFDSVPGSRIYKTGDRARYLANGNIEFLGRSDHQVKIRGFRIELGEIESALNRHPSIKESVVIVSDDRDDKRLTAYVVAEGAKTVPHNELRGYLSERLPEYMLPSTFVALDRFPLTPNGKVDRRALPAPDLAQINGEREYIEPRDSLQYQLTRVWEEVLGRGPIGIRDNFFELGGHSILAVRLFAQIENVLRRRLPLATLFQAQTVEEMSKVMRQAGWQPPWSTLVPIQPSGTRPPFFCVHAAGGNVLFYRELARHLGSDQPLYALQAQELDGSRPLEIRVEDLAARYVEEIRSLQPDGPFLLGGRCFGGLVAFEMAQQLHRRSQKVARLIIFDSAPPNTLGFSHDRETPKGKSPGHYVQRSVYHLRHGQFHEVLLRWLSERKMSRKTANWLDERRTRAAGDTEMLRVRRLERAYIRAAKKYIGSAYEGRITLIRSAEFAALVRKDFHLRWRDLALEGFEHFVMPGTHLGMFEEPAVQALAERLGSCLAAGQSKGVSFGALTKTIV